MASTGAESEVRGSRGYIDGCFDLMHSGHYNAIRQARMVCDVLVVGVHSDQEIADNKALPVMRQEERYALLEHIKWIDEIVHDVPYSPLLSTLELAKADFCIHGDDMPVNAQGVCAYDEMRDAGKLRIIKRTEGVSTTDLIGRLLTLARQEQRHGAPAFPAAPSEVPRKLDPDEVIDSVFRYRESSEAVGEAQRIIEQMASKYGIVKEDVQQLRYALAQMASSSSSSTSGAGKVCDDEALRTKAPVQLLTSTRRISEFSSARQPKEGDTVVYVCGSFDLFHVGHAQFLKDARALGTFLVVGIHDDVTCSREKGPYFPVMNLNERVLNVCACKWVDEVVIGAPREVTEDLIKTWNIKVVAAGTQHQRFGEGSPESKYAVPSKLGMFQEVVSKWPHLCHDTVVGRIMQDREVYLRRNKDRASREDVYYNNKTSSTPAEC